MTALVGDAYSFCRAEGHVRFAYIGIRIELHFMPGCWITHDGQCGSEEPVFACNSI
jgi:hypothetical protein